MQDADPGESVRNRWIDRARRIQAIAQTGLTYTEGVFDRKRYEELQTIAAQILADCSEGNAVDIQRTLELEDGYPTPKVDVRGIVLREGKILLVRERSDGLWTLPGGWADGGDTPAETVVREIREESGFETEARKILAVLDRDRENHPPLQWYVYKIFILCELTGGQAKASVETSEVGFFSPESLPPLSTDRVLEHQIRRMIKHAGNPDWPTDFN